MTSLVWRLLVAKIVMIEVRFLLRTIGFARTIALARRVPAVGALGGPDPRWRHEIAWAARAPLGGSCLDRSVVYWFCAHMWSVPTELRIGIQRTDDDIDAHAWVEHNGVVVNDDPAFVATFEPFDEDPTTLVFR